MDRIRKTAICMGAVAATALELGRMPVKVTVVPCNQDLGYVQYDFNKPGIELIGELEVSLKLAVTGHVAQRMFTDSLETGFVQELMRAREIAQRLHAFGDEREPDAIVMAAVESVRHTLTGNERNIRRLADALMREGTLDARALQQVIGGE